MRAYNMFYCGDFTKVDARCEEFWFNALQEWAPYWPHVYHEVLSWSPSQVCHGRVGNDAWYIQLFNASKSREHSTNTTATFYVASHSCSVLVKWVALCNQHKNSSKPLQLIGTHTLINNFERNLSLNQNLHDSWEGSRINLTEYNATYTEAPPVLRHQAKVSFSVRPAARLNVSKRYIFFCYHVQLCINTSAIIACFSSSMFLPVLELHMANL